ncbi:hypothetical protein M422DRAFT_236622, partial [Sphaerobolus stellatus SS14]
MLPGMFEVDTEVVNLLGTDYVPNFLETQSIGEIMARYENTMRGMDAKLEELRNEMARIQDAKQQVQLKLHKLLGLLAPIRRLPPELLGQTFVHALLITPSWPNQDICVNDISSKTMPLVLLRVCKRWRRIALHTPRLF